jgi:hypothetical protein
VATKLEKSIKRELEIDGKAYDADWPGRAPKTMW